MKDTSSGFWKELLGDEEGKWSSRRVTSLVCTAVLCYAFLAKYAPDLALTQSITFIAVSGIGTAALGKYVKIKTARNPTKGDELNDSNDSIEP